MTKILIMILFSVSMFAAPFADDRLTVSSIKKGDTELTASSTDTGKESDLDELYFNIEDFDGESAKINISYTFNQNTGDTFEKVTVEGNSKTLDDSTAESGTLSFNLKDLYDSMPTSDDNNYSFKITVTAKYKALNQSDDSSSDLEFTLYYDTLAPDKPTDLKLSPGNENIHVSWKHAADSEDKDHAKYMIYYQEANEGNSEDDYSTKEISNGEDGKIDGLRNGTDYLVYLKAVDSAGNESEKTDDESMTPVPVDDFYKYYRNSGGAEDGGYCFIATAAYGSYDHGMVKILRNFRDNYLPDSVINTYYKYSPPLANIIAESKTLSFISRIILEPVVIYANFFLYASILFKMLILSLFMLLLFIKVKVRVRGIYNA